MQIEIGGFSPAPDVICENEKLGPMAAVVFGKMWRYCQMSDGVCKASMERIARECGMSRQTALTHAQRLVEEGYLIDTTPNNSASPHVYKDTGRWRMRLSFEERQEAARQPSKNLTPSEDTPLQNLEATPPKFRGKDSIKTQSINDNNNEPPIGAFVAHWEKQTATYAAPVIRDEIAEWVRGGGTFEYFQECTRAYVTGGGRNWNFMAIILRDGPNKPAPKPTTAPRPDYRGKRVSTPAAPPSPGPMPRPELTQQERAQAEWILALQAKERAEAQARKAAQAGR